MKPGRHLILVVRLICQSGVFAMVITFKVRDFFQQLIGHRSADVQVSAIVGSNLIQFLKPAVE